PELVDGEVDRVRNRTGEVFGYRRGGGQVTVCKVSQFVEQTQNRGLVTLVGIGSIHQTTTGAAIHGDTNNTQTKYCNHRQSQQQLVVDRSGGRLGGYFIRD